jgi:hypothetical protein
VIALAARGMPPSAARAPVELRADVVGDRLIEELAPAADPRRERLVTCTMRPHVGDRDEVRNRIERICSSRRDCRTSSRSCMFSTALEAGGTELVGPVEQFEPPRSRRAP